ncbi:ester cyclase [Primorskyibacter sp. S87]|uniref:ester cyclase n=1 Tax=Primorskyibacter sp. S87 TaxID=3415126 RepID=UPI003C7BD3B2
MTNAELLHKWYEEVWVNGNLDAIDDYFTPDTKAAGIIPEMRVGIDDFRDLVGAFQMHLEDIKFEMPMIVEQGDWASAILKADMKRADNGAPVTVTGMTMVRTNGQRIVEAYNQFDYVSLFEQLGQMPPDTLPIAMTGQKLDFA